MLWYNTIPIFHNFISIVTQSDLSRFRLSVVHKGAIVFSFPCLMSLSWWVVVVECMTNVKVAIKLAGFPCTSRRISDNPCSSSRASSSGMVIRFFLPTNKIGILDSTLVFLQETTQCEDWFFPVHEWQSIASALAHAKNHSCASIRHETSVSNGYNTVMIGFYPFLHGDERINDAIATRALGLWHC